MVSFQDFQRHLNAKRNQGAAENTLMEFKKMLIDPCIAKTFSFPRDVNELNQQLSHNYVMYYDNIWEMKDPDL